MDNPIDNPDDHAAVFIGRTEALAEVTDLTVPNLARG